MAYTIIIESSADRELDEAYRWIAENNSPENAMLWYFDILEAIKTLENLPERCALAPENQFFREEIRQLLYVKYRILFEIYDEAVRVRASAAPPTARHSPCARRPVAVPHPF